MNAAILASLVGLFGIGLGFMSGVVTRPSRERSSDGTTPRRVGMTIGETAA